MTERHCHNADSLYRSGVSAYQNGDLKTALELVLKAIEIDSNASEYYNTFGVILAQAGGEQGAIKAYRKAIELNNDYGEAYSNLGNCLQKQNKYSESIEYYATAIKLNPDHAEAHNNLAAALYKLGNFKSSIENCRKAIKLRENYAEAYNTLAAALQAEQRFDEAIECYDKTVEYAPEYAEAYYSRGMLYLCNGEFAKGWDDYQWRLKTEKTKVTLRHDKPCWQGENFHGKTLLVQAEQGFGDSMQFVRYLPMVKERGGTVILAEKPELIGLFRNLDGIDEIVDTAKVIEGDVKYDLYITLLSLPKIFYIKIGIAWAGNPTHGNEHNRSCALKDFIPLAKIKNVTLFSLQKGIAIEQINNWPEDLELINLGQEFEDFTDTAAAIENMDMTISVDTSVLHLAGAMGKIALALISYGPDWRWMLNREDSPWYPTISLFRQKQHGDWDELFHRVADRVENLNRKTNGHKQHIFRSRK